MKLNVERPTVYLQTANGGCTSFTHTHTTLCAHHNASITEPHAFSK